MATYRMPAPDGQTYQIDGPDGATDEQIKAEIIKQNPHLAEPAQEQEFQKPPRQGVFPSIGHRVKQGSDMLYAGGKRVADAIYPAAPAPEKPFLQSAKDTALEVGKGLGTSALGLTVAAFAPLAGVGEAARPAGEALHRATARSPEQLQQDLAEAEDSLRRATTANDPLWIKNAEVYLENLKAGIQKSPEQREYETGETTALSAEMLAGAAFPPGPGIFRGAIPAEKSFAALLPRAMRGRMPAGPPSPASIGDFARPPAKLTPEQQPRLDLDAIQAPPSRQIRKPFEEAPTVLERPAPPPAAVPEPPLPTAAAVAAERTGGQIAPKQPEPSRLLDAQGRQVRPTPEPAEGTARRLVSPETPETPLKPAEQPRLLRSAGEMAEERSGGIVKPKPETRPTDPKGTQRQMDVEAESEIERALRQGVEEGPTERLIREGRGISGGSAAEDVGWVTPAGKKVSHTGQKAPSEIELPGGGFEMTHSEALLNLHGEADFGAALNRGFVRYTQAGKHLGIEVGPTNESINNAITLIKETRPRYVSLDVTTPDGKLLKGIVEKRPYEILQELESLRPTPEATARTMRPISGASDAPIAPGDQPIPSAREIGMRRTPKDTPEVTPEAPAPTPEAPTAPKPELGSELKTPFKLKPAEIENAIKAELPAEVANLVGSKRTPPGTLARWKARLRKALPQEEFVRRESKDSPVITEMAWYHAEQAERLDGVLKAPWMRAVKKMEPDDLKRLEQTAVDIWEASDKTPEALETAIRSWPEELKEYARFRNQTLADEALARKNMGLDPLDELPGPYLPHKIDTELNTTINIGGGGYRQALPTNVGGAQYHRQFRTMLEGEAAGMNYIDPRNAILLREWDSIRMTQTERLLKSLKNRALFETEEAAKAVSKTGEAFPISGLPGAELYWAPTKAEALFLAQNLAQRPLGIQIPFIGSLKTYSDLLFRNPNLVNPAPHITKNMWAKYILASGDVNPGTVIRDGIELFRNPNLDSVKLFREFMPYADTDPAYALLQHALVKGKVETAFQTGLDTLAKLNKPSAHVIFKWGDPAMRYSLFKKYISKGMSPQEAANHAWVDLVNYATRSDLVDMWKSIPMNFFVPWRVGSVTSVAKQAITHPVRAAIVIGGVDLLRELRYRETGRWTHLPWDYFEGPVVTAVEAMLEGNVSQLGFEVFANALFGPSGEATAGNIKRMMTESKSGSDAMKHLGKVFWGIVQLFPSSEIASEFAKFSKDGDPSHFINAVMAALVAERDTKGYKPHRVLKAIPESVMPKSRKVRGAELSNPVNQ